MPIGSSGFVYKVPLRVSWRSRSRLGGLACSGELGLARRPVEQQHVQRLFHLPHPVTQGAGHHAHVAGGGGKAAMLGNDLQHGEGIGGQDVAG